MVTDTYIERALSKAPYCKPGETGYTNYPLKDGMVMCIEYHTEGKLNICDDCQEMTSERYDWLTHGCSNAAEWRAYLNKMMWREHRAGLK